MPILLLDTVYWCNAYCQTTWQC